MAFDREFKASIQTLKVSPERETCIYYLINSIY